MIGLAVEVDRASTMTAWASIMAWLHVIAVVLAIGGSAFVLIFLRPQALKLLETPHAVRLMGGVQARFRWVMWGAIVVFIVTGVWLAWEFRGIRDVDALVSTSFGRTLLIKSILALVLFANALAITVPWRRLAWFRQRQVVIMQTNLLLAGVIVLLATFMVRRGGLL